MNGFFKDLAGAFSNLPQISSPISTTRSQPKNIDLKGSLTQIGSFLRDIVASAPRAAISTGLSASRTISKNLGLRDSMTQFQPQGRVQELVFGKEPVLPIKERGTELATSLGASNKLGLPLGLALTALDFTGFGKKSLIEAIAKSSDEKVISALLKKNLKGDLESLVPKLAKISDAKIVKQEIDNFLKSKSYSRIISQRELDILEKTGALPVDDNGQILIIKPGKEGSVRGIGPSKKYRVTFNENIEGKITSADTPMQASASQIVKDDIASIEPLAKERGFISSAKEAVPGASKIAGQYVPRETDDLAIKAKNLIKDDLNTAENLALTGSDDKAVATASELLKHYAAEAEKATDLAIKNALYDKAAQVANTLAPKLTEQGRSIQAASILGRLTPEGQVRFAAGEISKYNETAALGKKIPELTGEQANKIIDEMKTINGMADGKEKAMRFQNLQNFITDLVPTPLFKKIIAVWKAGLLTGLKTTGVNVFANLSHAGTETAKDLPATVVDKVISLFTGKRTKSFTLRGLFGGGKEGAEKGFQYLKTGFDERNIGTKLDYSKINFGKGKIARGLQAYTDSVFRILGTEDQPFYYAAKLRSMYEQAKVAAINKGLKGGEAQKFIDDLIENPTDEMIKYASTDAEVAVFQNRTVLGEAAKKIQTIGGGAGEVVVPFSRTPAAVAMQIINYSPAGAFIEIAKQLKKGSFDQRAFSTAMGRSLTGTGALALGSYLFKKGLVTTSRPTGEKEQKLWELEGKQPNSVKIGDKWRQVQVLGPLGNLLLIGGSFQKAFDNSGSPSEAMAEGLADASKSFTQQTFLTGVSNFIDAISDPARSAATVAGSTLASTIPTIVSDIGRATDTKERRANSIFEKFQARIPGIREGLEPQVNVLGEERGTVGNPLEILADPTRPSEARSTPLIEELRRLWDEGFKVSPTLLGDKKGYSSLTSEENTELWKRAGEIIDSKLSKLIVNQGYQKLSDDEKSKYIEDFVDKSKTSARAEMVLKLTEGLQGEELKTKLSELKSSGLMSNEVFNLWLKIR